MNAIVVAVIVAAVILALPTVSSHLIYHRSFMATLTESVLRRQERTGYRDEAAAIRKIAENDSEARYRIPEKHVPKVGMEESELNGIQYFRMNPQDDPKHVIVYLAGGGFLHPPKVFHWKMLDRIARKTGAEVYVPIYGRLPTHTAKDIYPAITDFYRSIADSHPDSKMILGGDSSGGNIVFVIAEQLIAEGYRQPDEIISISPPSGYTYEGHEEEFAPYAKVCPVLGPGGVNYLAAEWAGDLDVLDYRVSPIFGNVRGMGRVTIFAGERELLYPSSLAMHRVLLENGVDSEFVSGRGMNHVYPAFPIPEARKAQRRICRIVLRS